jgi:hypothetical protein
MQHALPGDQLSYLQWLLDRSDQRFNRHDFLFCPRHQNTPRQFECTRLITAEHVKSVLRRSPGFGGV